MTADKSANMQNDFFNRARKDGGQVTIYLTNGKKLTGRIRSFDKFTVLLESNRIEQMIFKHAISTVSTGRPTGGGPGRGRERPQRQEEPAPAGARVAPEPAPPRPGPSSPPESEA